MLVAAVLVVDKSVQPAFGLTEDAGAVDVARAGGQARRFVALWLLQVQRADNEEVARHLGFHDSASFRRSFKRWTGLTPRPIRAALDGELGGLAAGAASRWDDAYAAGGT